MIEYVPDSTSSFCVVLSLMKPNSARTVPMPSINQLTEVFESLPDEPKGPIRRVGPQYERRARPKPNTATTKGRWYDRYLPASFVKETESKPYNNPMGALRNGDRAFIVAVNDSGNTGWVRFGRTGFAEAAVM
jgi:tRNA-splicing endonuclease subunit Sen54